MAIERSSDAPADARDGAQRLQRMLTVPLHCRRLGATSVVVRNISPLGLGGMCKQWLGPDEEVEVDLPNIGRVQARVAWMDDTRFGLAFASRIDPARVTRDRAAGMDSSFQVLDRFRPETSARRPPINYR